MTQTINLSLPARLYQFRGSRLPLGAAVRHAGLLCRVTGRTFRDERYDLRGPEGQVFNDVTLEGLEVDFRSLSNGT